MVVSKLGCQALPVCEGEAVKRRCRGSGAGRRRCPREPLLTRGQGWPQARGWACRQAAGAAGGGSFFLVLEDNKSGYLGRTAAGGTPGQRHGQGQPS